jgi:hypothetical protein
MGTFKSLSQIQPVPQGNSCEFAHAAFWILFGWILLIMN